MELTVDQAKKIIEKFDYESINVKSNTKSHIITVKVSGDRKEFLKQIKEKLERSNFIAELVERSSFSRSSGHVKISNIYIVSKPVAGPTENLGIYASTLTKYGDQFSLDIFGETSVKCSVFNNHTKIIQSIMQSFEENKKVSPWIIKVFDEYFRNITENPVEFNWNSKIKDSEKNELGKYLGEVILGVIIASDGSSTICSDSKFLKDVDPVKRIIYPVASNFKNIDSIVHSKKYIPISNKLGKGASASFFSNLLPFIESSKSPVLKRILNSKKKYKDLSPTEIQFGIIYDYGLNYILELKESDPIKIFYDLKNHKESNKVLTTVKRIKEYVKRNPSKTTEKVLEYLKREFHYCAVTGFLCREIAKDFNKDQKSISEMEQIISTKKFYQANLNYKDWLKGKVNYSITQGHKLNLVIIGDKSGYTNLFCPNGKLTYELRMN